MTTKMTFSLPQILNNLRIEELNAMQNATIESGQKHDELIVLSATGSGKTLAFLFSMLQGFTKEEKTTQALIIVPSRELALQIEKVFKLMGTGLKITCCYGGHKREIEENNLIDAPTVIVGTPGRMADHIRRGNINTSLIHTLILDEFDKSLELGFSDEIREIIESLPALKRRILTSATAADEIPDFVGLKDPFEVNFLDENAPVSEALSLQYIISDSPDKLQTLYQLLCFLGSRSAVVFCNHKESVERISSFLKEEGVPNEAYHGSVEQKDREVALAKFHNGSVNFLITTDLAARGLDIPHIRYIIHYHLPHTEAIFTHRNGRTARMDNSGTAILILSEEEQLPDYVAEKIQLLELPELKDLEAPTKTKWTTLYLSLGKKNKVNKIDIVGFFSKIGQLKAEDIGLIDVKDFATYVAIRKSKVSQALLNTREQRIKNKKVKIEVAK